MRYIDRTNCKAIADKGIDREVTRLAGLTKESIVKMAKEELAILKTRSGVYRIIRECGLGCPDRNYPDFATLAEADKFIKANV